MTKIFKNIKNNNVLFLRLWVAYLAYSLISAAIYYVGYHISFNKENIYSNIVNGVGDSSVNLYLFYFKEFFISNVNVKIYGEYFTITFVLIYLFITICLLCFLGNPKKNYFNNDRFFLLVLVFLSINLSLGMIRVETIATDSFNQRIKDFLMIRCMSQDSCRQKIKIVNHIYFKTNTSLNKNFDNDYRNTVFAITTNNRNPLIKNNNLNESQIYNSFILKYGNKISIESQN